MSMDEYRHKIFRFWALYATGACTVLSVALEITTGMTALAVVTGVIWFSVFLRNCYYAYQDRRDRKAGERREREANTRATMDSFRPDRQRVREQIAQQMLHKPREKG